MPSVATIASMIPGFVMDAPKLDKKEPIQIDAPISPPPMNQQWTIVSHADVDSIPAGYVNIFAGAESSSKLCIDIPHSIAKERKPVHLYPVDGPGGHPNQQWKLIPVGKDGYVYIASALDNDLVLDVQGGEGVAGAQIDIFKRGDMKPNQMWILNPVP